MNSVYEIIRRPIVSEKSTALAEVAQRYVFEVDIHARKEEIKKAVEKLFKVQVRKVRTAVMPSRARRWGRYEFRKPKWKKAIVTLGEGQKIEIAKTST